MRRRLIVVAAAITVMVALAFLIPLIVLVRTVARDRAITDAERDAGAVAPLIAITTDPADIAVGVASTPAGREGRLSVLLANGTEIGPEIPKDDELALAQARTAFTASHSDGVVVYVPVLSGAGTSVVRVSVPDALLEKGVGRSTAVLIVLAVVLVLGAIAVSDRLGASLVRPVRRLAGAAERLGEGDLTQRVEPEGPPEIAAVANAFNLLAGRVGELLAAERELVADLSHRLRTPLTVLRHEADAVPDAEARERVRAAAVEVEEAVTALIAEARRPIASAGGAATDLAKITHERVEFWRVLAEDQGRPLDVELDRGPLCVALVPSELEAAIDALLGNVFDHTADGTGFAVRLRQVDGFAELVVEDAGSGVDAGAGERGRSGGGSTGLGLDIVRRTARAASGELFIERSELGGACMRVRLPIVR